MEHNSKTNRKKEPKRKRKILDTIIIVFLCFVLIGSVSGFFILSRVIAKVSDVDSSLLEKIVNVEPTEIYAANGKKIEERGQESRELITYEQLPQVTVDAFLAIEDSRFFSHNGFDLPRFISSAFSNLRSGSLSQGGSTLTMQTIDNFIIKPKEEALNNEGKNMSSLERIESKIQEIYLSMRLDSQMSKKDILTNYLNKVNFGSSMNSRGIQKGAQYYFGKDVEQLNLSESAFLAGVINAPALYNPYKGYDAENKQNFYAYATERRNSTLSMMLTHGYITENEYKLAKATKLAFQLEGEPEQTDIYPYSAYVDQVMQEAQQLTGVDPATTPMKIYTALDTDVQDQMNRFSERKDINLPDNDIFQIASVAINNQTGEIIAINDGFNDSAANYKSRSMIDLHAPGSTMKPLLEYALAFDKLGWATSRTILDEKMDVNGHVIVNYDEKYHGTISLERAIAQSLNVPAVKAMLEVEEGIGKTEIVKYLKALGFNDDIAELYDYQYAIGAGNMLATPAQLAAAFSALANGGNYIEPHMITRIEFKDGSKTIDNKPQKTQALSEQAAYMVSDLLYKSVNGRYNIYNYMGSVFSGCGYPVYGKTGTSDWGDEQSLIAGGMRKDGWMVNYTSEYTICSWNGFDALVEGQSYISSAVQDMNIPGYMNRIILDMLSNNATKLQQPDGLSNYKGGLIKDEFLSRADEINPNTKDEEGERYAKELLSKIEALSEYDASKYTDESWSALQSILAKAKEAATTGSVSKEDYDSYVRQLESAVSGLKEKTTVDKSALINAIANATPYMNTSQYDDDAVLQLATAVNAGSALLDNNDATQEQIDSAVSAINAAIAACQNAELPQETENPQTPPQT